jgi:hypothetical protein
MSMAAATANWKLAESADASSIAKPNARESCEFHVNTHNTKAAQP